MKPEDLLESYVVIERHHNWHLKNEDVVWDAGAIVRFLQPLATSGAVSSPDVPGETFYGD